MQDKLTSQGLWWLQFPARCKLHSTPTLLRVLQAFEVHQLWDFVRIVCFFPLFLGYMALTRVLQDFPFPLQRCDEAPPVTESGGVLRNTVPPTALARCTSRVVQVLPVKCSPMPLSLSAAQGQRWRSVPPLFLPSYFRLLLEAV